MAIEWSLKGRKALVTGATKGIGLAVAEELLSLCAEVMVVARDESAISRHLDRWETQGAKVFGVAADVAIAEGRKDIFDSVKENFGHLDVLVNNVGTNIRKPTLSFTQSEYQSLINTNMVSTLECSRLAHPFLARGRGPSIVNISSVAGAVPVGTGSIYAMTKAAIDQMTRYLAVE